MSRIAIASQTSVRQAEGAPTFVRGVGRVSKSHRLAHQRAAKSRRSFSVREMLLATGGDALLRPPLYRSCQGLRMNQSEFRSRWTTSMSVAAGAAYSLNAEAVVDDEHRRQ